MKYYLLLFMFFSLQTFANPAFDALEGLPHQIHKMKSLSEDNSYVFIFVRHANNAYDFTNLETVKNSLLYNSNGYKEDQIVGHTSMALKCSQKIGLKLSTGMTGEMSNQFNNLIQSGWGLSAFFAIMDDGELESPNTISEDLKKYANMGIMSWIGFEITDSDCVELSNRLYRFSAFDLQKQYGFDLKPEKMEGANCSSFLKYLIDSTSLKAMTKNWVQQIHIPLKFLGKGEDLLDARFTDSFLAWTTQESISAIKLYLFSNWSPKNQLSLKLDLVDPELILFQIHDLLRASYFYNSKAFPKNYIPTTRKGFTYFTSSGKNIFKSKVVDLNFGPQYKKVYSYNKKYLYPKISNSKFKIEKIENIPGIIIYK